MPTQRQRTSRPSEPRERSGDRKGGSPTGEAPRTEMSMKRRELLRLVGYALAAPAAGKFFGAWLQAAHAVPRRSFESAQVAPAEPPLLRNYTPKFFDAADFAALSAFTQILIPTDGTPGAREAHCAHFIDFVLQASEKHAPDTIRQWRTAMRALMDAGFHDADDRGKASLVEAMSRPERVTGATHPCYAAYWLIKAQNTFAFYTSRAGMIEALDYKGNSYNASFPACEHPEHRTV